MTTLQTLVTGQAQKEVVLNENMLAVAPAALFARRSSTTSGLTWGYYGGWMWTDDGSLTLISDGTVALADGSPDAVNYIEATKAGVVSANTTGFTNGDIPLYTVTVTSGQISSYSDRRTCGVSGLMSIREAFIIACSDEVSEITAATDVTSFRMPYAMTLTHLRASVTVAPDAAVGSPDNALYIDVNVNGVSILYTRLKIEQSAKINTTGTGLISDGSSPAGWLLGTAKILADDDEITIDVDQGATGARGLKVALIGTRSAQ